MAVVLLIVLVVVEIALAAVTLAKQKSKKEWARNRLVANGIELLFYLGMTLLPGIDFSFRFKALLLLLVFRFAFSGIRFGICCIKAGKGQKKQKNPVWLVMGTVFANLLLFGSMIPAFVFKDYHGREMTGEYDVAMAHVILVDESRVETFEDDGSKREVPIYFYYPENAREGETYPLILFSHGAFGYYESNTSTYMELASHGYVVVSMEHPYHALFITDTAGKMIIVDSKFISDALTVGNSNELSGEEANKVDREWMSLRKADMNFVIDTIKTAGNQTLSSECWELCGFSESEILGILNHIDYGKIGLMGHSLGGATAVAVGRERDDISAVIDLDGTMLGERIGYENGDCVMNEEPYPVPVLSIDNESHYKDGLELGSYYVNNVVIQNAVDGQHSYIVGAEHMNFTDLPLFSPILASLFGMGTIDAGHCIDTVNGIVLNYMDSYLKGTGSYQVEEFYR